MIYRMLAIVVIVILLQNCKTSDPYKNFKKEIRTKKIKDYDMIEELLKNLKGKIMNFKDKDWLHEIYFVNGNKAISFTKDELLGDYISIIKKIGKSKINKSLTKVRDLLW